MRKFPRVLNCILLVASFCFFSTGCNTTAEQGEGASHPILSKAVGAAFPEFKDAIKKAGDSVVEQIQVSSCEEELRSNMRRLKVALTMYADEHSKKFPTIIDSQLASYLARTPRFIPDKGELNQTASTQTSNGLCNPFNKQVEWPSVDGTIRDAKSIRNGPPPMLAPGKIQYFCYDSGRGFCLIGGGSDGKALRDLNDASKTFVVVDAGQTEVLNEIELAAKEEQVRINMSNLAIAVGVFAAQNNGKYPRTIDKKVAACMSGARDPRSFENGPINPFTNQNEWPTVTPTSNIELEQSGKIPQIPAGQLQYSTANGDFGIMGGGADGKALPDRARNKPVLVLTSKYIFPERAK